MAGGANSIFYTQAINHLWQGNIDLSSEASLVMILLKDAPNGDPDDPDHTSVGSVVDTSVASECDFTNYSRKTVTGTTLTTDNTNNRMEFTFSRLTYDSAGGATNNDIGGALLMTFNTDDDTSTPLAFWNLGTITTSGTTITIDSGSEGAIQGTYS